MAIHIRKVAKQGWMLTLRVSLLLLILASVGIGLLIGTEAGRITIAQQATTFYRLYSGTDLSISGIESPAIGEWRVYSLQWSPKASEMNVSLQQLQVSWRWSFALQNRWWLPEVAIEKASVTLVETTKKDQNAVRDYASLWQRIPALRLEQLQIDELELIRPRYPSLSLEVAAQADLNWGVIPARFIVSIIDRNSANEVALQVSAEGLDQFRLKGALKASGEDDWSQWLKWSLPQDIDANWNVFVDYSTENRLKVEVEQSALPWKNHLFTVNGKIDYLINEQQFNFDQLAMQLDDQPASIDGWINRKESDLAIDVSQWTLAPLLDFFKLEDIQGNVDGSLQWLGGWRTPRINGQMIASGQWRGIPLYAAIDSEAKSTLAHIEQAEIRAGKNTFFVSGDIDWRSSSLLLSYRTTIKKGAFLNNLVAKLPSALEFESSLEGIIEGDINAPTVKYSGITRATYLGDNYSASIEGSVDKSQVAIDSYSVFGRGALLKGDALLALDGLDWRTNLKVSELDSSMLDMLSVQLPIDWAAKLSGDFRIESTNQNIELSGVANLLGQYQQQPLNAELDIKALTKSSLSLASSTIRIGSGFVQGSGLVDWLDSKWALNLTHRDFSLANIRPWVPSWPDLISTLDLSLTGKTTLSNNWTRPMVSTESSVVGSWFGLPISADLTTQPETLNQWQISLTDAQWFDGQFSYQGQLDVFNLAADGEFSVTDWALEDFIRFNQSVLNRPLVLPESLTGDLNAQLTVLGTPSEYDVQGNVHFLGTYEQQLLTTNVRVNSLTTEYIEIADFDSQWSENTAQFDGRYNWINGAYQVDLNASVNNVEPLRDLLIPFIADKNLQRLFDNWSGNLITAVVVKNTDGDSYIEGELESQGDLFGAGYQLQWQGAGSWQDILNQQVKAQWGDANFSADVELNEQELSGKIALSQLTISQLQQIFPDIPSQMSGQLNTLVDVSGPVSSPAISLSTELNGGWQDLAKLHTWSAKLNAQLEQQQWQIEQGFIEVVDGGRVEIKGAGNKTIGNLVLQADIPQTAYWVADTELGPGQSKVTLKLAGDLLRPDIELDASWQAQSWPILLSTKVRTVEDKIKWTGTLFSDGLNRLKTALTLPKQSWREWQENWREIPFQANMVVHTPLSVLDPFFIDRPNQSVTGLLAGQYDFTGSFLQPNWQGQLELRDGQFENISTGTLIDDVDLTLLANGLNFDVVGFANDGRNGLLELNGRVAFEPTADDLVDHQIDIGIKSFNANLMNDSRIDATVTGALSAQGKYHQLLVAGALDVSPLNLQTETFLLDGVPQLNIVESLELVEQEDPARPYYWPEGEWEVEVTANNRANLYGQGISAELAGSMQMRGSFYESVFSGRFNVVRGTYSGLGKVFNVTGGSVQIQNNQLVFNVEANYVESNLNVDLTISGNQDELTLQLSSIPALDQNELLAQLVFGESIENISELQAIQLAYLVNNIRTGTTSFDLIGATRQELSLDSLIIDPQTDEEGNLGVNIRAGKYLNNYLYLEVEQNVGSDEGFRSSLQLQVSPNTYLELFAEEAIGTGGAELNWSIDY